MKKVLFTATVDSHILHFHMPHIKWFQDHGYEVHVASNGVTRIKGVDKKFNVPFERQPLKSESWEAYKVLRVIVENNHYDIIHCHTPMGALLTRLAARDTRKTGTKVLYTAHGFHFFKGAPVKNWVIYYSVEKLLAHYTDCLITINHEDFDMANDRHFKAQAIKYVHGVGVDLNRFHSASSVQKTRLRKEYGYHENDFIMVYVAELSHRKNQTLLIDMMHKLKSNVPQARLLLVGEGDFDEAYKEKTRKLDLTENIQFLGYRKDVDKLMQLSDLAVSSSRQEGLPVNVMEAMATGLPLVVTNCRGNRDLVRQNINGYVVEIDDTERFAEKVTLLYRERELRKRFGQRSTQLMEMYSLKSIMLELDDIYEGYIEHV